MAYGVKLAELGVDMKFIKEVMGHSSVSVTEKYYAKFRPEAAINEVRKALEFKPKDERDTKKN